MSKVYIVNYEHQAGKPAATGSYQAKVAGP